MNSRARLAFTSVARDAMEPRLNDPVVLPSIEIETRASPGAAVIFLHGLGDTGHGWSDVVPAMKLPTTLGVRFLFPHAPEMPVTINGGYVMPAWYDIRDADLQDRADLAGVRASQQHVARLVARERARGIPSRRIVLGGFSQGGAVALYTALRYPEPLGGAAALSAYLIDGATLAAEAAAGNRDLPLFMAHGTDDDVVLHAWGETSRDELREAGWRVEWHQYPMGHAAVVEEIEALGRFIANVLA